MLCFCEYAKAPQLFVNVLHEGLYTGLDNTEVVVFQLLAFGGLCSVEGTPRIDKVLTLIEGFLVYEEVFLLRPNRRLYGGYVVLTKQLQYAECLTVDSFHRAEQGGFLVQSIAAVRAECRGDTKYAVLNECVGSCIPSGVTSRFEGGTKTARRERGRIGFPLNELLARKLHDNSAIFVGGDEAVVLFRRDTRHGLEPVGVVGCAVFHSPILHRRRNCVSNGQIKAAPVLNGALHQCVRLGGQTLLHDLVVKHHTTEVFRYRSHKTYSFVIISRVFPDERNEKKARQRLL